MPTIENETEKNQPKLGERWAARAAEGAQTREAEAPEPTLDQRVTAIETWFHDNGYTLPPAIPPEPEPKEGEAEEAAAKEREAQDRSAQERLAQERSAQTRAAESRPAEPRPIEPPPTEDKAAA